MLQKSTNKYERASGMHIAAKTRVNEAEKRVFGGGPKRAFDTALQEMLNQATIEVKLLYIDTFDLKSFNCINCRNI